MQPFGPPMAVQFQGRGEVLAAGGVVWRPGPGGEPEVCLVHRPKYDDWSLPKGKLHDREHPLAGAVREIEEETGVVALPQVRLPTVGYMGPGGLPKRVDYWLMRAVGGVDFVPNREVDELRWLPPAQVAEKLSYDHDVGVVEVAAGLPTAGAVVVLLRHGYAGERDKWDGPDEDRPLDADGVRRAEALVDVLAAFAPGLGSGRLISATPVRCRQTLGPVARRLGLTITLDPVFNEDADPSEAARRLRSLGRGTGATIVCSQGRLIPKVLALLTGDPPDGYATRKGDAWLIAFPLDADMSDIPDLVGLDRLTGPPI